jgi:hypothetical protein
MKRTIVLATVSMALALSVSDVGAANRHRWIAGTLEPRQEVPFVLSPATGFFLALLDQDEQALEYTLKFEGLQAPITQSHIHLAQPNVNGGIVIWLCGTASNPGPAGTQVCPQSGEISGTITSSNVVAAASQGISAGDFEKVIGALRAGLGYANIHTSQSPGGEIRAQLTARRTARR